MVFFFIIIIKRATHFVFYLHFSNFRGQLLRPNEKIQNEMIVGGLAEILFRVADGEEVIFCLPGPDNCFEASASYGIDGVTEKVVFYTIFFLSMYYFSFFIVEIVQV